MLFGAASGARLAWHVTYRASPSAFYDAVVDATDGAVLYRQNLVHDARRRAGLPEPSRGVARRQAVDLEDYGLHPGATVLDGTYARAWSDVDDDDEIGAGEEIPNSAGTDFVYPFTPFSSSDPGARRSAAPTPRTRARGTPPTATPGRPTASRTASRPSISPSRFHDHLAGDAVFFTDDWGNFEVGGTGGDDPVELNTDDGADTAGDGGPDEDHVNNANMSTPPDGESPRMQMYLMQDSGTDALDFRSINSGDDSGTCCGTSTRTASPTGSSSTPTGRAR